MTKNLIKVFFLDYLYWLFKNSTYILICYIFNYLNSQFVEWFKRISVLIEHHDFKLLFLTLRDL